MNDQHTVLYSPAALDDLRSIYAYISYELLAPQATKSTVNRIRTEVRQLEQLPEKHRQVEREPWAFMGMRLMAVKNMSSAVRQTTAPPR